ncbi:Ribokinase [Rubripirellula lacrimiformis]|uniref:Ribokinase n=1 Tax=Rubripirellula lacrimiformis TaxID=1930273 RepID=A0A517N967_9BACT|nr:ribokinase [Rubripirellula lacrimiformis]QDT03687.1 Ribokinase [Rubripirellula lacrimiformis]
MNEFKRSSRICVIGSANVDLTFRTPRLPLPGETLAGRSLHQGMGGKGANQAVAAARLGAQVTFVARVGNDVFGDQAIHGYQADGIDTSFVQKDANLPTGTAAILVDDHAENCIIVVAGANDGLTATDIQAAASFIEQADLVLCQMETPIEASLAAMRIARAAGVTTVLTPAPVGCVTDELLELCDVCVPNMTEIAVLADCPQTTTKPADTERVGPSPEIQAPEIQAPEIPSREVQTLEGFDDAIGAAQRLRGRGVQQVVLTMGSRGALVLDDTGPTHLPAISVAAVDTTGAGDAFTAALAVSLADGLELRDAAGIARIVAAISVTRIGTQTSFPTSDELTPWISK